MILGVHFVGRKTLEQLQAKRKQLAINVVGVLALTRDITRNSPAPRSGRSRFEGPSAPAGRSKTRSRAEWSDIYRIAAVPPG
jgi:hypothetical protein